MQKVDHFSIYLLIAGSYTPFCLVTLRWALGLDVVRDCLGAGADRHLAGDQATLGGADSVDRDLRGDGLDRAGGGQAIAGGAGWRRVAWLASGGVLYTVGLSLPSIIACAMPTGSGICS